MSFPRYGSYRDSGLECLGELPSHWSTAPLKRLGSIRYGIGEPPSYHDEGVPLIRATNVDHGQISPVGMVFVDPAEIPEKRILWLREGDIIVVRSGAYTGDSAIICSEHTPAIAGFDMVIRPTVCEPKFLQYALLSSYLQDGQIELERLRAAQPHLNAEELGSCTVALPEPQEQRTIAAFLNRETAKIDALVEAQRRLIELLKEKRRAVISHAVTKGLNPSAPMKDSGVEWLGEVPAHWTKMRLKGLSASFCDGPFGSGLKSEHYVDDGVRVARLQNIKANAFDGSDAAFIDTGYFEKELARHDVQPGDVLLAGLGDERNIVGRSCVAPDDIGPAMVKADCFRFRLQASANPYFVSNQLSAGATFAAGMMSSGSTRSRIPLSVMADRIVTLPDTEEQAHIVQHIGALTAQIEILAEQAGRSIALLSERRAGLISAAVTGKIDVRGLAAVSEEAQAA